MTASLIYPEKNLGKEFWDRVYAKAQQMYGTTQIPVNTFNKVWILADKATVYEHNQTAYVLKGHLKVMLEEDYLALQKHSPSFFKEGVRGSSNNSHSIASQIIKQIILPELEKEVNTGKNFSTLRQIFNSLILADWYKTTLKKSLLTQLYANQNKIKGIERGIPPLFYKEGARGSSIHPQQDLSPESIYQQYLKAYKKGVFNYIKEESDLVSLRGTSEASDEAISSEGPSTPGLPGGNHKRTTIPRKYFSGGFGANVQETVEHAMSPTEQSRAQETIATGHDFAMKVILDINDSYQAKNSNKLSTSKAMISTQLLGAIIRDFQGHVLLPILMSLNLNNPESVPFESGSINYTLGVTKGSSTVKITLYRGRFITTELYEMTIDKISYMQILSVNNLLKKMLEVKKIEEGTGSKEPSPATLRGPDSNWEKNLTTKAAGRTEGYLSDWNTLFLQDDDLKVNSKMLQLTAAHASSAGLKKQPQGKTILIFVDQKALDARGKLTLEKVKELVSSALGHKAMISLEQFVSVTGDYVALRGVDHKKSDVEKIITDGLLFQGAKLETRMSANGEFLYLHDNKGSLDLADELLSIVAEVGNFQRSFALDESSGQGPEGIALNGQSKEQVEVQVREILEAILEMIHVSSKAMSVRELILSSDTDVVSGDIEALDGQKVEITLLRRDNGGYEVDFGVPRSRQFLTGNPPRIFLYGSFVIILDGEHLYFCVVFKKGGYSLIGGILDFQTNKISPRLLRLIDTPDLSTLEHVKSVGLKEDTITAVVKLRDGDIDRGVTLDFDLKRLNDHFWEQKVVSTVKDVWGGERSSDDQDAKSIVQSLKTSTGKDFSYEILSDTAGRIGEGFVDSSNGYTIYPSELDLIQYSSLVHFTGSEGDREFYVLAKGRGPYPLLFFPTNKAMNGNVFKEKLFQISTDNGFKPSSIFLRRNGVKDLLTVLNALEKSLRQELWSGYTLSIVSKELLKMSLEHNENIHVIKEWLVERYGLIIPDGRSFVQLNIWDQRDADHDKPKKKALEMMERITMAVRQDARQLSQQFNLRIPANLSQGPAVQYDGSLLFEDGIVIGNNGNYYIYTQPEIEHILPNLRKLKIQIEALSEQIRLSKFHPFRSDKSLLKGLTNDQFLSVWLKERYNLRPNKVGRGAFNGDGKSFIFTPFDAYHPEEAVARKTALKLIRKDIKTLDAIFSKKETAKATAKAMIVPAFPTGDFLMTSLDGRNQELNVASHFEQTRVTWLDSDQSGSPEIRNIFMQGEGRMVWAYPQKGMLILKVKDRLKVMALKKHLNMTPVPASDIRAVLHWEDQVSVKFNDDNEIINVKDVKTEGKKLLITIDEGQPVELGLDLLADQLKSPKKDIGTILIENCKGRIFKAGEALSSFSSHEEAENQDALGRFGQYVPVEGFNEKMIGVSREEVSVDKRKFVLQMDPQGFISFIIALKEKSEDLYNRFISMLIFPSPIKNNSLTRFVQEYTEEFKSGAMKHLIEERLLQSGEVPNVARYNQLKLSRDQVIDQLIRDKSRLVQVINEKSNPVADIEKLTASNYLYHGIIYFSGQISVVLVPNQAMTAAQRDSGRIKDLVEKLGVKLLKQQYIGRLENNGVKIVPTVGGVATITHLYGIKPGMYVFDLQRKERVMVTWKTPINPTSLLIVMRYPADGSTNYLLYVGDTRATKRNKPSFNHAMAVEELALKSATGADEVAREIEALDGKKVKITFLRSDKGTYAVNFGTEHANQIIIGSPPRIFLYGSLVIILEGELLTFYVMNQKGNFSVIGHRMMEFQENHKTPSDLLPFHWRYTGALLGVKDVDYKEDTFTAKVELRRKGKEVIQMDFNLKKLNDFFWEKNLTKVPTNKAMNSSLPKIIELLKEANKEIPTSRSQNESIRTAINNFRINISAASLALSMGLTSNDGIIRIERALVAAMVNYTTTPGIVYLRKNSPRPIIRYQKQYRQVAKAVNQLLALALRERNAKKASKEVAQAMSAVVKQRLQTATKTNASMYGGIDLTAASSGITVTRAPQGGVQVTVDPAMIARIREHGIQSAVPVIVDVHQILLPDISPLLGFGNDHPQQELAKI